MASLEELRNTFFDECSELLQEIETGLSDMRDASGSEETVHAVFRAVHSVKGGAGIFGFEGLVEFAHVFETVLDAVRRESLSATPEVVSVLLTAGDVLTDIVGFARAGEAIPPDYGHDCRASLEHLICETNGAAADAHAEGSAPANFDGIDFVPVRADDFDATDNDSLRSIAIVFRPKPEMLKNANEPLYIVRELRKLGELELVAETGALPRLSELVPSHPYIGWTGTLRTTAPLSAVTDVFEFVVGDCELEITELAPAPDADPVSEDRPVEAAGEAVSVALAAPEQPATPPPHKGHEGPGAEKSAKAAASKPAATTTRVDVDRSTASSIWSANW